MRKDIEKSVSLETVKAILNMASEYDIEFYEIEGVLNDDYLIMNNRKIRLGKNVKAREYIIIEARFMNYWGNELVVIQTDDEEKAEQKYKEWEMDMDRQEKEWEEMKAGNLK